MTQGSTHDINKNVLATAIKFEEDGRKLFLECVNKTEHPWGKSLFQSLADDELMHIERLKETDRGFAFEELKKKHPREFDPPRIW